MLDSIRCMSYSDCYMSFSNYYASLSGSKYGTFE